MTRDLIGSKKEIYDRLSSLPKSQFIDEFKNLMINGKWGSGKSYLLQEVENLAKEKGVKIIIIDAWSMEYLESAERMIMVKLLQEFHDSLAIELLNTVGDKTKKMFSSYLSETKESDLKVEKVFKRAINAKKTFYENSKYSEYSNMLDDLAYEYLDESVLKELKVDIIVFDELDRVLPETFIEIIKFIKYFTDASAQIAVSASLNLEQCNSMIKHLYGEHFSSHIYLDKIFKTEYKILNYYIEKAKYIADLVPSTPLNLRHNEKLKNWVCRYYFEESDYIGASVGFGLEKFELREIENFITHNLDQYDFKLTLGAGHSEIEKKSKVLMVVFYILYNEKYAPEINEKLFEEIDSYKSFPCHIQSNDIDIKCEIHEEMALVIKGMKDSTLPNHVKGLLSSYNIVR